MVDKLNEVGGEVRKWKGRSKRLALMVSAANSEKDTITQQILEEKKRYLKEREKEFKKWEEAVGQKSRGGRWGRIKGWWKRKRRRGGECYLGEIGC